MIHIGYCKGASTGRKKVRGEACDREPVFSALH